MASRSDNTAIQNLRAHHRAQLAAIKTYEQRTAKVQAAYHNVTAAREILAAAEHQQQLALATLAALVGDANLVATTVDVTPATVTRASKTVEVADVRAEVDRLLNETLPRRAHSRDAATTAQPDIEIAASQPLLAKP